MMTMIRGTGMEPSGGQMVSQLWTWASLLAPRSAREVSSFSLLMVKSPFCGATVLLRMFFFSFLLFFKASNYSEYRLIGYLLVQVFVA